MPIEKLLGRIGRDARDEADRLLNVARLERYEILSKTEQEAEAKYNTTFESARREVEDEKRRSVAREALACRIRLLEERQELISEVFKRAKEAVEALPHEKYLELAVAMLVRAAGDRDWEVLLGGTDRDRFGEELVERANRSLEGAGKQNRLTLSAEVRPIHGGFILHSKGLEVNNTLEALVSSRREELEEMVAKVLFGPAFRFTAVWGTGQEKEL